MADEIDKANDTAALHLDIALRNYKQSGTMPPVAQHTGYCLHCGADLPPPRRWCDAEHRDKWQETYR